MKLDRNAFGRGKYGIVKNRRLLELVDPVGDSRNAKNMDEVGRMKIREAVKLLVEEGVIDFGDTPETEFFVIRLRDEFARPGLIGYAGAASVSGDIEYASEVFELANRAGRKNPHCKKPD